MSPAVRAKLSAKLKAYWAAKKAGKIAFIGGGNMATAMIRGLVDAGRKGTTLIVSEPLAPKRRILTRKYGAKATASNTEAASAAEIVVLAVKPQIIEGVLVKHGLKNLPLTLRITGCPNGCARPYLAEIALIGRAPGRYTLRLGADAIGQRLNVVYRDNIDENAILTALDELIGRFSAERQPDERFGDFLWRAQVLGPRA